MANLSTLIERVEALTGPDREVDCAIAVSLGFYDLWKSKHGYWNVEGIDGERFTVPGRPSDMAFDPATGQKLSPEQPPFDWADEAGLPEWTASIDAAVALVERVLPGWTLYASITDGTADDLYLLGPNFRDGQPEQNSSPPVGGKPVALALTLAALRALHAQEERDG